MPEHFTLTTISAAFWCAKCGKQTQHRIDSRRKGPCLDCIARLAAEHAQREIDARRTEKQRELFA